MPGSGHSSAADDWERALVEAAQRDPAHVAEIYDEYFDRVYAFLSRRVMNRTDAEDLTAEVFQHRTFTRLKQLEYLIRTQQIDDHFFWNE